MLNTMVMEVPFLGKFDLKIQNCLFKSKFGTYNNSFFLF